METTDATFVARARTGDSDAFRVLVERHSRALFRLAFRMTGNQQDAEDVVQESFLRAYKQLGKFDERATFGTWLYRIAANCSLDLVRSRVSTAFFVEIDAHFLNGGTAQVIHLVLAGTGQTFQVQNLNIVSVDRRPEGLACFDDDAAVAVVVLVRDEVIAD